MHKVLPVFVVILVLSVLAVTAQAAPPPFTCADIQAQDSWLRAYIERLLNCNANAVATLTPDTTTPPPTVSRISTSATTATLQAQRTASATTAATLAPRTAAPVVTRAPATPTTVAPKALTQLVRDQIVTALYADPSGTLYYGVAEKPEYLAETLQGGYALWKKAPDREPQQLTPWTKNLIGGITVRGGMIYFNEAGALRRMPDDGDMHEGDVLIRFTTLSKIYAHVNHSLAQANMNGQDALLIAVGSVRDSAFPAPGTGQDVYPPYYEDFPTGRILYATFAWLETANGYEATRGVAGQFDELARGFRNPWGVAVGVVNGATHILAADNDPAFTPEKNDANPSDAGDELNDVFLATNYGHPYTYAGQEPAIGARPPIVIFPDGSVPSGVAVAGGKVFVSLQNAGMVVKVDIVKRTWTPVLTGIQPYNISGTGNLLYIADFGGIQVIDARGL